VIVQKCSQSHELGKYQYGFKTPHLFVCARTWTKIIFSCFP
jgi:hypothetical protein